MGYDDENYSEAAMELEHQQEKEDRLSFLKESHAIPTPIEIYAIWIELYARQGGKTRLVNRNYEKTAHVDERNNSYYVDGEANTPIAYENLGWRDWCPTQNGGQIPANYGSSAMTLLILPEVTGQSLEPAKDDWRGGWEFGHTKILSVVRDDESITGFRAETNEQYGVSTYPDVEALRKSMNLEQMLAKYNMRKGTKALPSVFPTGLTATTTTPAKEETALSLTKGKTVPAEKGLRKMLRWLVAA